MESFFPQPAEDKKGEIPTPPEALDDFVRRTQGMDIPDELIEIEEAYATTDSWISKCCKSYAERFMYLQNRIMEIRDLIISKIEKSE